MTATLDKPKDQRLIHSGIDWQQFKLIEQGFYDEVEILAVSHSSRYQFLLISCHSECSEESPPMQRYTTFLSMTSKYPKFGFGKTDYLPSITCDRRVMKKVHEAKCCQI